MCQCICDECGCHCNTECVGYPHMETHCSTCVQCDRVKALQLEVTQLKRTLEQALSMITRGDAEFDLDVPASSTREERLAKIPFINGNLTYD